MRPIAKFTTGLLACTGLFGTAALAVQSASGGKTLTVTLTGAAEVPGPGDANGTGTAEITINPSKQQICYELEVTNIEPATMAHIHAGAVGVAGPVVVTLEPPTDGSSEGCVTDARMAAQLWARPANSYVNVHNTPYPAGAVRGQLPPR